MASIRSPHPVKPIVGLLFTEDSQVSRVREWVARHFSDFDQQSEPVGFGHSSYYSAEMGGPIRRQFVSLNDLIQPEQLVSFKHLSNGWEDALSVEGKRRVNIDPGYVSLHNVVLASAKDFSHRVYLGQGIYGDVNLICTGGRYQPLPWTYPDYEQHIPFFMQVRARCKEQQARWFAQYPESERR